MNSVRAGGWFALGITILTAFPATAAEKPVNLSLFTPISLAKAEDSVSGFRFNLIYGKNTSVKVVDLGLVNQTTTLSNGLQWGTINFNEGATSGVQLGAVNYDKGAASGLQWSAFFNYAGTEGGLQLAAVNYAEKLQGFQIGVLNIDKSGGMFPFMIIANWKK
jgi:hypothetical protein